MKTKVVNLNNEERLMLFPIVHHDMWELYQKCEQNTWSVENDIDFKEDIVHWANKLSEDEKLTLKRAYAYLINQYHIANWGNWELILKEYPYLELKHLISSKRKMNEVHFEAYSFTMHKFVIEGKEDNTIIQDISNSVCFKNKIEWVKIWIDNGSALQRIIALTVADSILNIGIICILRNFQRKSLMYGMTFTFELILIQRKIFSELGSLLHNNYCKIPLSQGEIGGMIEHAVAIESIYVNTYCSALSSVFKPKLIIQYVEYCADQLLLELKCEKKYNVNDPFQAENMLVYKNMTGYFEKRSND